MQFVFTPERVCSKMFMIEVDEKTRTITNFEFKGGCPGNLVEVMTCKTGCVGGAGQPYGLIPVKQQRAEGLYEADRTALIKRSERNPMVTKLLEGALKGRTHELLHVEYKRPDKA